METVSKPPCSAAASVATRPGTPSGTSASTSQRSGADGTTASCGDPPDVGVGPDTPAAAVPGPDQPDRILSRHTATLDPAAETQLLTADHLARPPTAIRARLDGLRLDPRANSGLGQPTTTIGVRRRVRFS